MIKMKKCLLAISCLCIAFATFVGCSSEQTETAPFELNLFNESVELELFEEFDLQYTATDDKKLTWIVADPSIATVSNGKIVALKEGETTVTLQSGTIKDVCTIKVNGLKGELFNIAVEQAQVSLYAGENYTINPTVTYGSKTLENATFTYESFDSAVASVSSTGVLTANTVGTTSVSVTATALQSTIERDGPRSLPQPIMMPLLTIQTPATFP